METNDWQAFNLATEALRDIDRFAAAPSTGRPKLVDARRKLQLALTRDPQFLRAKYYGAIVADMLGRPTEAIQELTELLDRRPSFVDEAEYNLAVSHYHVFSREHMETAIATFTRVAENSTDVTLKYMSNAGLVRAYAMMVLHNRVANVDVSRRFAEKAVAGGSELLNQVAADRTIDKRTRTQIEWRALNGRGVAWMFSSDIEQALSARVTALELALRDFVQATALSPENWEIVCNLGSSHMRLGSIMRISRRESESRSHFERAREFLVDVIERIRPDYGFALYELGRTYRLEGRYAEALVCFQKALYVPEDERNISSRSIEHEIEKSVTGTDAFP